MVFDLFEKEDAPFQKLDSTHGRDAHEEENAEKDGYWDETQDTRHGNGGSGQD